MRIRDSEACETDRLGGAGGSAHHRTIPDTDAAMPFVMERQVPIAPLLCPNVFTTFAWYGHPKYRNSPQVITLSEFAGVSTWFPDQPPTWNQRAGFDLDLIETARGLRQRIEIRT
jgi:uncharacterized protein (DUF486 family)